MEKRLEEFIASIKTLSDIRNLDEFNPITVQIEHPIIGSRYTVVAAKREPSYLGIPFNTTWVVLDPTDPYYLQALKLKDTIDPVTVTSKVASNGARWHVVRIYNEIFTDVQYYEYSGPPGPVGPTGPSARTVKVTSRTLAALGTIDLDPGEMFQDPAINPSEVEVIVGVQMTSGGLAGHMQTQPSLVQVGYSDTSIRLYNSSQTNLVLEVTLVKH